METSKERLKSVVKRPASQENKDKFVREVTAVPEFCILQASDQQLKDVKRFCCNPESFYVFGIDPTFNFRDYNLTLSFYRHFLFITDKRF